MDKFTKDWIRKERKREKENINKIFIKINEVLDGLDDNPDSYKHARAIGSIEAILTVVGKRTIKTN